MPTVNALWFPAAGHCEIRKERLTAPAAGQAMVRSLFSGVSRGTEALVFHGYVPERERERMRGPHMSGDFSFPVKYGYASVGTVEDGPQDILGKTVFCLHPHQDVFIAGIDMLHVLPDGLPPERAVLTANTETALNIVWDAEVQPGDRIAVFGAGVVGLLTAYLAAALPGANVVVVDKNPDRRTVAEKLGLTFAQAGALSGEFDRLINASASGEALAQALDHAAFEARIVEASWYGDKLVTLPLGGTFHSKRLTIASSQVGAVAPSMRGSRDLSQRLAEAMELLLDDRLDVLISGETVFSDMAEAYPDITANPHTLCHRIRY